MTCVASVVGIALARAAATTDYALQPVAVANGIYVLRGADENFNRDNGGNIVNTGFIVGDSGIITIDSGPSRNYAQQQRSAIGRVSALPVVRVFITHAHPDHFLGNQVYGGDLVAALPGTIAAVRASGEALSDNLYRLTGGWMSGTQVVVPGVVASDGPVRIAGRALRLIAAGGHTDADLMVYDEKTKTLFTGDLVFLGRAATTPNADIGRWLMALDEIDALDFRTLVPGHGAVSHDHAAVRETRDYLRWLYGSLQDAANRGLDMNEVMGLRLPERFKHLAVVDTEYVRSVVHLYPSIELNSLPSLQAGH